MENYLRIALLALAGIVVFLVIFEFAFRRRKHKATRGPDRADLASLIALDPRSAPYAAVAAKDPNLTMIEAEHTFGDEDEPFVTSTRIKPVLTPDALDSDAGIASKNSATASSYSSAARSTVTQHTTSNSITSHTAEAANANKDLLILTVVAKPGQQFVSYELLQALYSAGLQFGEMNIFHFYQMTFKGRVALFSLASATEPGDFNLDKMGDYACSGLTLFAHLSKVQDPQYVFDLMIKKAEQLADDLDGELRAGPRTSWTDAVKKQYQQKVLQYTTMTPL